MAIERVLGSSNPEITATTSVNADKNKMTLVIKGLYSQISAANFNTSQFYATNVWTEEAKTISSDGDGLGTLTLQLINYDRSTSSLSAVRVTHRISMQSVTLDLKDHPAIDESARVQIYKWLSTDEAKRYDGSDFFFLDNDGDLAQVDEEWAIKFCEAYRFGIHTFNRYFPVVEKISVWKRPNGVLPSGRSFPSGNFPFSANIGTFDGPEINLDGYEDDGWFKSGDNWVENVDTTWTRTEEWTYSPDAKGDYSWIYDDTQW